MKLKLKTLKAFSKRIKKNASCFTRKKANKGHLMRKKRPKRKRVLSQTVCLSKTQEKLANRLIFK